MKLKRRSMFGALAALVAAPALRPDPAPPVPDENVPTNGSEPIGFYGATPVPAPTGELEIAELITELKKLGLIA